MEETLIGREIKSELIPWYIFVIFTFKLSVFDLIHSILEFRYIINSRPVSTFSVKLIHLYVKRQLYPSIKTLFIYITHLPNHSGEEGDHAYVT